MNFYYNEELDTMVGRGEDGSVHEFPPCGKDDEDEPEEKSGFEVQGVTTAGSGRVPRAQQRCKNCKQIGHRRDRCPNATQEMGTQEPNDPPKDSEDLSDDERAEIIAKFNEGKPPTIPTNELAKEYGVSIKAIWHVIRNRPK